MPELPQRAPLHHEIPAWVGPGAVYFITICGEQRHRNTLATSQAGHALLESAAYYHAKQIWWIRLFLLMPDHRHALLAVAPDRRLDTTIRAWKSFHAKELGITWQSGFSDHRIRDGASLEEKAAYIRNNPVRAGLVPKPEEWPWIWQPRDMPARPW